MLYLSSITFNAPRSKAHSIYTGFVTKALIPKVSGLQATDSRQWMRLPRAKTLYLAHAVLLPEHEHAASGAHSVIVGIKNEKELKPGQIIFVLRKIRAAVRPVYRSSRNDQRHTARSMADRSWLAVSRSAQLLASAASHGVHLKYALLDPHPHTCGFTAEGLIIRRDVARRRMVISQVQQSK
jgi:hypothetical protein